MATEPTDDQLDEAVLDSLIDDAQFDAVLAQLYPDTFVTPEAREAIRVTSIQRVLLRMAQRAGHTRGGSGWTLLAVIPTNYHDSQNNPQNDPPPTLH